MGTWGGDWLATNVFHWNKTDINSDKPVCKGDIIAHQRKNIGLWGLAIGVLAGAAILFFGAMTFGFGLLAGFVAGSIIAAAHAMSQYGEEKGEIKEGSPDVTFEGRPVARMGDRVECRDHSPEEFIAEGVKTVTVNGRLLAKVGCRTTCDGNLDRKTETTIGVDKATATDPEKYPIRESTSLLAEFAATASIYAPWERMFGKARGAFSSKNNVEASPSESTTNISDDMIDKILWGQRKNPNKNELIGGHSPEISDSHPNYAVEEVQINPDGTKVKKFVTQFPDGNLSKIKKSTTFPEGWSDTQIIDGIKATGDSTPIGTRPRDGATLHRKTVDGVQIEVIKIGDDVVSGYPTGGTSTQLLSGFQ
ncbi:EndoU domain-containing protein [Aggregatibacter actinomycetemcomitans]|uniref:PAAR domain-containing protein n=1 Tax=Aggregatibacter actinomycetemcomitans TaxID=714 RepID=UPI00197C18DA|nr:EndoU domain-containing protein [Aggregatibacter actinomycetemcomitans]